MDISFDFKKSCFICRSKCIVERDPKHPSRWNKKLGALCRTADRGKGKQSFKDVLLQVIFLLFITEMVNITIFWIGVSIANFGYLNK